MFSLHARPFPSFDELTDREKEDLSRISYIITDTDNTMITHSCFVYNAEGNLSSRLIEALIEAKRRGIHIIPCTGRNRAMIREDARVFDFYGWIAEMGGIACVRKNGEDVWEYLTGEMAYDRSCGMTPHELIEKSGVVSTLLNEFGRTLEFYNDNKRGYQYREVTVAFRGWADESRVQEIIKNSSLALDWVNNGCAGRLPADSSLNIEDFPSASDICSRHIVPLGVNKGYAARAYMKMIGASSEEVLCCGDSPADCSMAGASKFFMIMKNGATNPLCVQAIETALTDVQNVCRTSNGASTSSDVSTSQVFVSSAPSCDGFAAMLECLCRLRRA